MIVRISVSLLVAGVCAAASPARAATYQVRDIHPGPAEADVLSLQGVGPSVGGHALLWTHTYGSRPAFWGTDGTAAGTHLLTDLIGGPVDSPGLGRSLCQSSTDWYFRSQSVYSNRNELWRTDGTLAGTSLIRSFPANSFVTGVEFFEPYPDCADRSLAGQTLFLVTRLYGDFQQGYELLSTDGTPDGTVVVEDLGEGVYGDSGTADIQTLGSTAVFIVNNLVSGMRLWRTDGTSGGTLPYFTPPPGYRPTTQYPLVRSGNVAFFGLSGSGPDLLGVTDGTAEGTEVFETIQYPALSPNLLTVGSRLLLTSGQRLWSVDTLTNFAVQLTDSPAYGAIVEQSEGLAGARALFLAESLEPGGTGEVRLLASDGTSAGTYDIGQICAPEKETDCEAHFLGSTPLGEILGVRRDLTYSILRSAGVAGDLLQIGTLGGAPSGFSIFGASTPERLYVLFDGAFDPDQLWTFDGSPGGSVQLNDPQPPAESFHFFGKPGSISGSLLVFGGGTASGMALWRSDGTPAGTVPYFVPPVDAPGSRIRSFSPSGQKVLFSALEPSAGEEPWVSDGTSSNTFRVAEMTPGSEYSPVQTALPAGTLWPLSVSGSSTSQLFVTHGQPGEYALLGAIAPVRDSASFGAKSVIWTGYDFWSVSDNPPTLTHLALVEDFGFAIWNETSEGATGIYFRDNTVNPPGEPWVTDGTQAGTRSYCTAPAVPTRTGGARIVEWGPGIVFAGDDPVLGDEIFHCAVEGGTAALLRDIHLGAGDSTPNELVRAATGIFFSATDAAGDRELWTTNGTPIGTVRVADIAADGSSDPQQLQVLDGQVVFSADDGVHGREPWISDGTPEGTQMIVDLAPGAFSSNPADFELVGSQLFFSAETLETGRELWFTGGAEGSTGLVSDIRSGPASSAPEEITRAGDRIYFRATDHRGTELWADWAGMIFADGLESGDFEAWDLP